MREALFITFILIFIFVVIGVIYNMLTPYLVKFGVMQEMKDIKDDGGIVRSQDFGRNWSRIEGDKNISRSNVRGLYFSHEDSSSIYAATSQGLYKTLNRGDVWERINLGLLSNATAFSQDPNNVQRMYAAGNSASGSKIYKARLGEFYEVYSSLDDEVLGVWVNPLDPAVVYAGTKNGFLLVSSDFGESWSIKSEFSAAFKKLKIIEKSMYAIIGEGILLRSDNRGASWSEIAPGISNISHISISPENEHILYLASADGLFRSQNGGASFSRINILSEDTSKISVIALDPRRPDVIYMGVGNQVHKSDDGGATWQIKTLNTSRIINIIEVMPDRPGTIFIGLSNEL